MASETLGRALAKDVGTSGTNIFTASYTSAAEYTVVLGIVLANTHSSAVTVDVELIPYNTSPSSIYLLKNLSIEAGNSYEVIQSRIVLYNNTSAGDVIKATCSTGSYIDAVVSYIQGV